MLDETIVRECCRSPRWRLAAAWSRLLLFRPCSDCPAQGSGGFSRRVAAAGERGSRRSNHRPCARFSDRRIFAHRGPVTRRHQRPLLQRPCGRLRVGSLAHVMCVQLSEVRLPDTPYSPFARPSRLGVAVDFHLVPALSDLAVRSDEVRSARCPCSCGRTSIVSARRRTCRRPRVRRPPAAESSSRTSWQSAPCLLRRERSHPARPPCCS